VNYIIAHDFGTSSDKAALFSTEGEMLKSSSIEYPVNRPGEGRTEQDPNDWWNAFCENNRVLTEGIDRKDVLAVTTDGTTSNTLILDEEGQPLRPAIIWQDNRAVKESKAIMSMLTPELADGRRFMGPGRSGVSLYWIKENEPELFARAKTWTCNNNFYIVWRLTGRSLADRAIGWSSGYTNKARTEWTYELTDMLGIPRHLLPELVDMEDIVGEVPASLADECCLAAGTKIVAGTGDGDIVPIGAGCVSDGDVSMTCGTSGGGSVIGFSGNLPGTSGTGASMEWLRRVICVPEEEQAKEQGKNVFDLITAAASTAPVGSRGVIFHPYPAGERGTRNNAKAKAGFTGISLATTREDMMRAVIEGIAMNISRHYTAYRAAGQKIEKINAIGGLCKSPFIMQVFADAIGAEIMTVLNSSWCGVIGGAMLCCVALGLCKDFKEAAGKFVRAEHTYQPDAGNYAKYQKLIPIFDAAYDANVPVYEQLWEFNQA